MKEAIGNSYLIMIAMIFLFIIMGLLVSALSFSKAFKAKNKIINVIEKYNGYNSESQEEVETDLFKMGYKTGKTGRTCETIDNMTIVHDTVAGSYDYCVYEVKTSRGYYYHVVTFTHFDIPILNDYVVFNVKGDSRTIYQGIEG